MRGAIFAAIAVVSTGFLSGPSVAADSDNDDTLPAVTVMPCTERCISVTHAVGITHPLPVYPTQYAGWYDTYVEGIVQLQYKIGEDGHVSSIAVLHLVGPKQFADITADTVKSWVYKPAESNGQPIAIAHKLTMVFAAPNVHQGARQEIQSAYSTAVRDIKDGKIDKAFAVLNDAQSQPRLNFYERSVLANLSSMIAMERGDFRLARRLVELPTFFPGSRVPNAVIQNLLRTRIKADLALVDMADACVSLERLKSTKGFDAAADPIVKTVSDARERVGELEAFYAPGEIPTPDVSDGFSFTLYRRSFGFVNVAGALDNVTISCREGVTESPVSDKAEWHIPKSWSGCELLVQGTPGTKFQIVQYKD